MQKKISTLIMTMVLGTSLCITGCGDQSTASNETASLTFESVNTEDISLIALGNSDVPVGQYSEEIFTNLGIWDEIQPKISFGGNVKEVLSQVALGSVDCGVVYATDAYTESGVEIVAFAPEGSIETPVVYPAALLQNCSQPEAAQAFLSYLQTEEAKEVFESVGFSMYDENSTVAEVSYPADADTATVTVFAAASMAESLTELGDSFMAAYPNIQLIFNFDSSGTLKTQIESGAEADLFISAAAKQMNGLQEENYINVDTRIDLLKNEVVLIVPANP